MYSVWLIFKLHYLHKSAAQGGNTQDCESLIEIGADVNWKGQEGDTPVLAACRRGHVGTVQLLIANGADINIAGNDTLAPVHVAARRGDTNTLSVLIEANAITTARTKDGHTALDIAKMKGYEDIYARLMQTRSLAAAIQQHQQQQLSHTRVERTSESKRQDMQSNGGSASLIGRAVGSLPALAGAPNLMATQISPRPSLQDSFSSMESLSSNITIPVPSSSSSTSPFVAPVLSVSLSMPLLPVAAPLSGKGASSGALAFGSHRDESPHRQQYQIMGHQHQVTVQ